MSIPGGVPSPTRARAGRLRPSGYVLLIVLAAAATFAYRVRVLGLFSCPAAGYAQGYYLAYCHGDTFGDYDHGAFWYELEPDAARAAAAADVLFLGSSRMQFGFSTAATSAWFSSWSLRHYLLGFGYTENVLFVSPLLARLTPRATAYVINVDRFFIENQTPPAAEILHGGDAARKKYEDKQRWQQPHRWLCGRLPLICGDQTAFIRRSADGHWRLDGHSQGAGRMVPAPVSDGPEDDRSRWPAFASLAERFVSELPVERRCVILTLVPYRDTRSAEAAAIAHALGIDLLEPQLAGLQTIDGSHLDQASAERWSAAFYEAVGPRIPRMREVTVMDSRPTTIDFSARLREVLASTDAAAMVDGLVALAQSAHGLLETTELDHALRKLSLEARSGLATTRLAVLSSSTIGHLLPAIRVGGLRRRQWIEIHKGGYGQYRQELLDRGSALSSFAPDMVLLSLTMADVIGQVPLSATSAEADRAVDAAIADLQALWTSARDRLGATVVQQSFLDVSEPVFGSFDSLVPGATARLVHRLNDRLADSASVAGVLWLDVTGAAARDGLDAWFDTGQWLHAKVEIAVKAAPRFGELLARVIAARRGLSRKCLVLDLDNTLWGGVLGDDGPEGIVLGEGSAVGEAHLALQRYVKLLKERGVILAVCSRNEPAIVESVFRDHPEMVLRRQDVSAFAVNWQDKAANLEAIAEELNIGLDSLVFLDDNPVERARVRESLPMVAVPELSDDPASFVRSLSDGGYFEAVSFTTEDRDRAAHYAANVDRSRLLSASSSVDEFLRGLDMTVVFGPISAIDMNRAAQLINKTNQFNTSGRRYSIDELRTFCETRGNVALQFRLSDRFGDNGIVSVILLRPHRDGGGRMDVDCWVMSCRVFGRQLEQEAMNVAVEAASQEGVTELTADYVPTSRNGVIKTLYEDLGFSRREISSDGPATRWFVPVSSYVPRPTFIARERQES